MPEDIDEAYCSVAVNYRVQGKQNAQEGERKQYSVRGKIAKLGSSNSGLLGSGPRLLGCDVLRADLSLIIPHS
jgi:hypothetical protein